MAETNDDAENTMIVFGRGGCVVDTGKYGGQAAVFIAGASQPGFVGMSAVRENHPRDKLQPGEIVLVFPDELQAKNVADALVGIPASCDPDHKCLLGQQLAKHIDFWSAKSNAADDRIAGLVRENESQRETMDRMYDSHVALSNSLDK